MARFAVIGIGNVLTGDDAIGPWVVKVLEARYALPDDVAVMDAGTPGYDLTAFIAGLEGVVLVDAVKARGPAGTVEVYDKAKLLSKAPVLAMSPHEPGVREALLNAEFQGVAPPVVKLVGVIPFDLRLRTALSPVVEAAVPAAVEAVVKELAALGVRAEPRGAPRAPDLWWLKDAPPMPE
jgi:hydrogenase maturation protease